MKKHAALAVVREIYLTALLREPGPAEQAHLADQLTDGKTPVERLKAIRRSKEFIARSAAKLHFPPGHYYSAIVDTSSIGEYYARECSRTLSEIQHIDIEPDRMADYWNEWREIIAAASFDEKKQEFRRFFLNNGNFPYGDALILRAQIAHVKPRRIIEIGSGNSTACMLDTLDEFDLATELVCIEPFPDVRLNKLLSRSDMSRIKLLECPVQEVDLSVFVQLDAGDILFIDSTHVLKTGSDVHYELFYVLPALKPGVIIHFHDCSFPFEYPAKWVLEYNYSWNELYGLRAFLMYNSNFKVRFWAQLLCQLNPQLIEETHPRLLHETGSSLWIEKCQASSQ
jgi:predicted O-methyltransferase YrrM